MLNPNFARYRLPVLAWLVLHFTLSSIPGSSLPDTGSWDFTSLAHVVIFTVLALLLSRDLDRGAGAKSATTLPKSAAAALANSPAARSDPATALSNSPAARSDPATALSKSAAARSDPATALSKSAAARMLLIFALGMAWGLSDEFHQEYFVRERGWDNWDLVMDAIGLCIGLALYHYYNFREAERGVN